jgi:itaconate CoA-transferase
MSFPMYYAFDGAAPPPRAGASHATIYPYGPFAAGDGKSVMLGLQNEREWAVFCDKVLRQPALVKDERFDANAKRSAARAPLRQIIETEFGRLTAAQVIERLEAAGIANAQVNTMADLWAHPQLQARRRWTEVSSPVGTVPALLPPGAADETHVRMDAIPAVGQHSETILRELGLSTADIEQLKNDKAI